MPEPMTRDLSQFQPGGMQAQVQPGMQTLGGQQTGGWNIQNPNPTGQAPQTGLYGAANTLYGGLHAAGQGLQKTMNQGLGNLGTYFDQGRQDILKAMQQASPQAGQFSDKGVASSIGQGVSALAGFADPGRQAMNLQAALTGSLGADKQAEAYANYLESPGQKYLRDQMERSVTRTAAARGGLGGGNVMRELQREAMGLAAQDFDKSFNRLAQTSGMGLQAAGQQGQLYGQQAGLMNALNIARGQAQTQANIAGAGNAASLGGQLGQMGLQAGLGGMNFIGDLGAQRAQNNLDVARDVGAMRWDVGQQIGQAQQNASNALANSIYGQGQYTADQIANAAGNLGQLLQGAGQQGAASNADLAQLLQQLASSGMSAFGNVQGIPGQQQLGDGLLGGAIKQGFGNLTGGMNFTGTEFR